MKREFNEERAESQLRTFKGNDLKEELTSRQVRRGESERSRREARSEWIKEAKFGSRIRRKGRTTGNRRGIRARRTRFEPTSEATKDDDDEARVKIM